MPARNVSCVLKAYTAPSLMTEMSSQPRPFVLPSFRR